MRKVCLPLVSFLLLSSALWAHTLPPALVVEQDGRSVRLGLAKLQTEVRIVGAVAETTSTMTFTNPMPQTLEGDFCFPLPEGATICGYALDIRGVMVDGVAVERRKGREVFEQIVRRRIDPGLAEWLEGNTFKTRVFPIPANGSRTIRVQYLSEIIGGRRDPAYHLPLNYQRPLKEFTLRIEVVKRSKPPKVTQGPLTDFTFHRAQDSYIADGKATEVLMNRDLVVALPAFDEPHVFVEKAEDGQFHFAIQDFPETAEPERAAAPQYIVVFWDASRSRANADHDREMGLLCAYFKSLRGSPTRPILVDLVSFANTMGEPKRIVLSKAEPSPLIKETPKSRLRRRNKPGGDRPARRCETGLLPALYGRNFHVRQGKAAGAGCPRIHFLDRPGFQPRAARRSRVGDRGPVLQPGTPRRCEGSACHRPAAVLLSSATVKDAEASEILSQSPQPVDDRFICVGKLAAAEAEVTLRYGTRDKPSQRRTFRVRRSSAENGSLLGRYWAQKKLADLMVLPRQREAEIVDLGMQFGMVTPYTSLIVLDSVEQYVEFRIPPPQSSPDMRDRYMKRMDAIGQQEQSDQANRLAEVIRTWQSHVREWEREVKVAPNFKYTERPEKPPKTGRRRSPSRVPRNFPNSRRGWSYGGMGGMGMGGMGMGGMGGAGASPGTGPVAPPSREPTPSAAASPLLAKREPAKAADSPPLWSGQDAR